MKKLLSISILGFSTMSLTSCMTRTDDLSLLQDEYAKLYDEYHANKDYVKHKDLEDKLVLAYEKNESSIVSITGSEVTDPYCTGFVTNNDGTDVTVLTSKRCYDAIDGTVGILTRYDRSNENGNIEFYADGVEITSLVGNAYVKKVKFPIQQTMETGVNDEFTPVTSASINSASIGNHVLSFSSPLTHEQIGAMTWGVVSGYSYAFADNSICTTATPEFKNYNETYIRTYNSDYDKNAATPHANAKYNYNEVNGNHLGTVFIQHDAATSITGESGEGHTPQLGGEGSPLFNIDGDLIGMNYANYDPYDLTGNNGIIAEGLSYALELENFIGLM